MTVIKYFDTAGPIPAPALAPEGHLITTFLFNYYHYFILLQIFFLAGFKWFDSA
jgi:hypothetical protein